MNIHPVLWQSSKLAASAATQWVKMQLLSFSPVMLRNMLMVCFTSMHALDIFPCYFLVVLRCIVVLCLLQMKKPWGRGWRSRLLCLILVLKYSVSLTLSTDLMSFIPTVKFIIWALAERHMCGPECLGDEDDPEKFKGHNPLLIPPLCGWQRQICKLRAQCKRVVLYVAPCLRRLRCIEDVDHFLALTNSKLTIDLFCFDAGLLIDMEYVPVKVSQWLSSISS